MGACISVNEKPEGSGAQPRRQSINSKGECIDLDEKERPEDDFFEFDDLEIENMDDIQVKEFMAVKPWIGAVKEPQNHLPVNKDKPDQ